jgi:5-hydroxyisourate hydrolase-like protein (transthyretin family)
MPSLFLGMISYNLFLDLIYALVAVVILRLSHPVYIAFRKRRSGYGVVFNSITGQPEPLVAIRLVTATASRQTVSSAVSDRDGRYHLTARPGEYLVEATKADFSFPSTHLKEHSSVYDNILPSAHIVIKDHGILTKNIPVDPVGAQGRSKIFRTFHLGKGTQYVLAYGSPFFLVLYPYFREALLPWIFFWIYMADVVHRLFTYKPAPPAFGEIRNKETKEPVEQAVVRIFEAKFNKLLETQVTGPHGRYAFVVHPGSYYLVIQKTGYRTVRINFPVIKKDGFVMAKDIALQRVVEGMEGG